jgi:hypothetical protein
MTEPPLYIKKKDVQRSTKLVIQVDAYSFGEKGCRSSKETYCHELGVYQIMNRKTSEAPFPIGLLETT